MTLEDVRICIVCGKEYTVGKRKNGNIGNPKQKYCSRKCSNLIAARKKIGYRENAGNCLKCGNLIVHNEGMKRFKKNTHYCSQHCYKKSYNKMLQETGRISEILKRKKEKRLGRQIGDTCEICGTPFIMVTTYKDRYTPRRVPFHIDHIIPKSLGGENTPDNLRAVCWLCNTIRCDSPIPDAIIAKTSNYFWKLMNDNTTVEL